MDPLLFNKMSLLFKKISLSVVFILIRLAARVIVSFPTVGGRIVEIRRVLVSTSITVVKFPNRLDTILEMSFTVLLVANAPRLTGV
jgi:hypothetical protein